MSAVVQVGAEAREEFSSRAVAMRAETAAVAVAAAAKAEIEARYVMALKRPRDLDAVRVALLKDCARPGFAERARYRKPIGKGIEGPSIRFVEAALGRMGNVLVTSPTIYDDESKRIVRVGVTDLETNTSYSKDVTIDKTVERSKLSDGQRPLGQRTNSQGKVTYLVAATDDDLLNKEGALISKAIRTSGLRILPSDLVEESMSHVLAALEKGARSDPDAAQKAVADAFASIGVQPGALKDYLGHDLATCSPKEIADLRAIFATIRDGETTWHEVASAKKQESAPATESALKSPPADLKASLKAKREAKKAEPAPAAAPAQAPDLKARLSEVAFTYGADDARIAEAAKRAKVDLGALTEARLSDIENALTAMDQADSERG